MQDMGRLCKSIPGLTFEILGTMPADAVQELIVINDTVTALGNASQSKSPRSDPIGRG